MSEIAKKKALEKYPIQMVWVGNQYGGPEDINSFSREKYQEGYNQAMQDIEKQIEDSVIEKSNGEVTIEDLVAYNQGFKIGRELSMQDFLEKACEYLYQRQVILEVPNIDKFIEYFKNYMEKEL